MQQYIQKYYAGLKFSPAVDTLVKDIKRSPKRMQREAKRQMQETGIGTKSQQALKLQQEKNKQERKIRSREKKEEADQKAAMFYSIMFFYYSLYDGAKDKKKIKEQFEKTISSIL